MLVMEQLINMMPSDLRVWIRERRPKSTLEAGELADQYMQARGSVRLEGGKQDKWPTERRRCHECKEMGHIAKDCPKSRNPRGSEGRDSKDKRPLTCFNCHRGVQGN